MGGGARSGKSRFALQLAAKRGSRRAFIATGQAHDDEMRARIATHQAERVGFDTIEAPIGLSAALRHATDFDVILVDCLTLYLSNSLLAAAGELVAQPGYESEALRLAAASAEVEHELDRLLWAIAEVSVPIIVVTNEVGQGIVPDNALARTFRDLAGRANQRFAKQADELYVAFFGQLLRLKPAPLAVFGDGAECP